MNNSAILSVGTRPHEAKPEPQQNVAKPEPQKSITSNSGRQVQTTTETVTTQPRKPCVLEKTRLFLRTIKKCLVLAYHYINFKLSASFSSTEGYKHKLNKLGPVLSKLIPPGQNFDSVESFAHHAATKQFFDYRAETEDEIVDIIKGNPNHQVSTDQAQQILNDKFGEKYNVLSFFPSGDLSSCFKIEDEKGKSYIAKVLTPEVSAQLKQEIEACRILTPLLSIKHHQTLNSILNNMRYECDDITNNPCISEYSFDITEKRKNIGVNFTDHNNKAHKIDFTVMGPMISSVQKEDGYTLQDLKNNDFIFHQEIIKCLGLQGKNTNYYREGLDRLFIMQLIKEKASDKLTNILLSEGLIYPDITHEDIKISFNTNKRINISISNKGNSFKLAPTRVDIICQIARKMNEYYKLTNKTEYNVVSDKLEKGRLKRNKKILQQITQKEADLIESIANLSQSITGSSLEKSNKETLYRSIFNVLAQSNETKTLCESEDNETKISQHLLEVISSFYCGKTSRPSWLTRLNDSIHNKDLELNVRALLVRGLMSINQTTTKEVA